MPESLHIAQSASTPLYLLSNMSNRHGLVAGATGTGKAVTLQVMAESFSRIGVPVFAADMKGDLSGISQPGTDHPKIAERVKQLNLTDFSFSHSPAVRSGFGMSSANKAIRSALRSPRWGRSIQPPAGSERH
jgi:DNA helicase HerA-like ATPase